MNEFDRLNLNPTPSRSVGGVMMTAAEYARFEELANPFPLAESMMQSKTYQQMNDLRKRVALSLVIEHGLSEAEAQVEGSPEFSGLRKRIRAVEARRFREKHEST